MNNIEKPELSEEEILKLERQRIISDAELLENGAKYKHGEDGELKLETTLEQKEKIDGDRNREIESEIIRQKEKEKKEIQEKDHKIWKELNSLTISEILEKRPELKEKIEAIALSEKNFDEKEILLILDKSIPGLGILIENKAGNDVGSIDFDIKEPRDSSGETHIKRAIVCFNCALSRSRRKMYDERENFNFPKHPGHVKPENRGVYEKVEAETKNRQINSNYKYEVSRWEKSEEGQKYLAWEEEQKSELKERERKIAEEVLGVCLQNGIKRIAVGTNKDKTPEFYRILEKEGVEIISMMDDQLLAKLSKMSGIIKSYY